MSDYIDQVKDQVRSIASQFGLKILPRGKSSFSLIKDGQVYMTVRDTGDNVEISFGGKKYMYDKWYTKPEHLTQVIVNVLEANLGQKKSEG